MPADNDLTDVFGPPIFVYTRAQAIEDGELVDVSEWASRREMTGGFACPVAMTRALWALVSEERPHEDTRGRAHDVLWLASLALRGALAREDDRADFDVTVTGRDGKRKRSLRAVADGDGVTIGFPEDF